MAAVFDSSSNPEQSRDRGSAGQAAPSAALRAARQIMVELEDDLSNQLFEILADWNQQLTAENIDYSGLST